MGAASLRVLLAVVVMASVANIALAFAPTPHARRVSVEGKPTLASRPYVTLARAPGRACVTSGLLGDILSDIVEYVDQLGGYDESFSERQLKGEVDLTQPKGPRAVEKKTTDGFVVFLISFAVTLLLIVGHFVEESGTKLFD